MVASAVLLRGRGDSPVAASAKLPFEVGPMKRKKSGLPPVQIVTGSVTRHLLEQRIRDVRAAGLPYEIIDLDRRCVRRRRVCGDDEVGR